MSGSGSGAGNDRHSTDATVQIRPAEASDIPAIQAIYQHYVATSVVTFEEASPSMEEMRARYAAVQAAGLPYIVAEVNGAIAGYAYASYYHVRPAYRTTVENAVYLSPAHTGRGLGRVLLRALIAECEQGPSRKMVALIADPAGEGARSVALHAKEGFLPVGTLTDVGFKLGRWLDTTLLQRSLGVGSALPPCN